MTRASLRPLLCSLAALFSTLSFSCAAQATITRVQEAENLVAGCAAGASCNPGAFGVNVTAGNLIIACAYFATNRTVSSVTDTLTNTYVLGTQQQETVANGFRTQCATAKNIAGGADTVTFNFSASSAFSGVAASEYSGADTASPVDVATQAAGSASTMDSGSVTTNFANELIFGFGVPDGSGSQVTAGGTGFTVRAPALPNGGGIVEDKNVTVAGANNATATCNASCTGWTMHVIGIKDATQPAGGHKRLPTLGVGAVFVDATESHNPVPGTLILRQSIVYEYPDGRVGAFEMGEANYPVDANGRVTLNVSLPDQSAGTWWLVAQLRDANWNDVWDRIIPVALRNHDDIVTAAAGVSQARITFVTDRVL